MSFCEKLVFIGVTLIAIIMSCFFAFFHRMPQPSQSVSKWWGPGQPRKLDESIRNFKINTSEEMLEDLMRRLEITSPISIDEISEYNININYLNEIIAHWKTKYNWREREVFLNRYPHFKTYIQGLDVHFIHIKHKEIKKSVHVLPLLLVHGWPGSVRDFYKIVPFLTTSRADANFVFEIVAPSLPGYGFSDRASKPGLGLQDIAVVMKNLMNRLGFKKFYAQGGDWGASIVENLSTLFPESVLGVHSNTCRSNTYMSHFIQIFESFIPSFVIDEIKINKIFEDFYIFLMEKFCSRQNQLDTIGVSLRDSPVGLAAYILERFSIWTNKSQASSGLTMIDVLDNIMIYWISGAITNPQQFNKASLGLNIDSIPSTVPTGCAMFPEDLFYTPESLLGGKLPNLVRLKDMPRGGHFPALEEPELLSNEIWETVKLIEYYKYTIL